MPASYSNTFSREEERKSLRMNENSKNIFFTKFIQVYGYVDMLLRPFLGSWKRALLRQIPESEVFPADLRVWRDILWPLTHKTY